MRKICASKSFELSVAECGIVWIHNNDWLEPGSECGDEVSEDYARTIHTRKQDERKHRTMNRES